MQSGLEKPQPPAGHRALSLGQLLVASGLLTQQALDEVLLVQKADGRRLGELLEAKGLVQSHQLAQFLSHQLSCPWVSLQRVEVTREAVDVLPRAIALKHHMVPVHLRTSKGGTAALYVAMDDPTDDIALSEASAATTMPVKPMVALSSDIRTHLERLYGADAVAAAFPIKTSERAPEKAPDAVRPRTPSFATIPPAPPTITVKDDTAAHAGPVARATPTRPPKPPPPKSSWRPPETERESEVVLDDFELVDDANPVSSLQDEPEAVTQPRPAPVARILVISSRVTDRVLGTLRKAARSYGAEAIATSLDAAPSSRRTTHRAPSS